MIEKSESVAKLAAALAVAQGKFPAAKFDATNAFLKNKYASLGSIIEAAKPILAENGLSVSQLMIGGGDHIGISTVLLHSSGEWIESTVVMPINDEKGKSVAQAAGSVVTYLRRYALASILGIYADDDTDGHQSAGDKKVEQPATKKAPEEQPGNGKPAKQATQPLPEMKLVGIGKNKYPASWGKEFASSGLYQKANGFEIDGILQKFQLPLDAPVDIVINTVGVYLEAKANGNDDPLHSAKNYYIAMSPGEMPK